MLLQLRNLILFSPFLLIFFAACTKENTQRNLQFLDCDPVIEVIPGVEGIFHHLLMRDNTLFAASTVYGEGGLYKYENGMVEQILDQSFEVYDLNLDESGNLWVCVSGGPQTRGIYRYSITNELTRIIDQNCGDLEIGNAGEIYFIAGQGTLDEVALQNIRILNPMTGEVGFATNPADSLFKSLLTRFIQSSDGSFWATTHKNELVHTTSSEILDIFSSDNNDLFPNEHSGILILSEQNGQVLFSFVEDKDWQVILFQNGAWEEMELSSNYTPQYPSRLIYQVQIFEGDWWLSSSWGLYQVSPTDGLIGHFYSENSPISGDHINRVFIRDSEEAWISYFEDKRLEALTCQ